MVRRLRLILALVAIVSLAATATASAAKSVTLTPKRPGPNSIVTVTVKNAKVKQAFRAHGRLYAELTPPPAVQNADGDLDGCAIHHPPQGRYLAAGKTAKFRMVPGDALAGPGHWCQGLWKVRLYAMLDGFSDNTDSGHVEITIARTTFTAHA
jgi:hypothetical protein